MGSVVVFDGPLEPRWAEQLHLALDDAIFALPDSLERMVLPQAETDNGQRVVKVVLGGTGRWKRR